MVKALRKPANKTVNNIRRPDKADKITMNSKLYQYVTAETLQFFPILNLKPDFFSINPVKWSANASFVEAQLRVAVLQVVNDVAERAVKLVSDYNGKITNNALSIAVLNINKSTTK